MNQKPNLRIAVPEDMDNICNIENVCFPGPESYSREQLSYLAFKANSACIVDVGPEGMRGFIIVLFRKNTRIGYVETIDVDKKYRGLGIGFNLLSAVEKEARARGKTISRLEVSEGNLVAIGLYEKAGYKVTGRIENYYIYLHHGTRHALKMEKELR